MWSMRIFFFQNESQKKKSFVKFRRKLDLSGRSVVQRSTGQSASFATCTLVLYIIQQYVNSYRVAHVTRSPPPPPPPFSQPGRRGQAHRSAAPAWPRRATGRPHSHAGGPRSTPSTRGGPWRPALPSRRVAPKEWHGRCCRRLATLAWLAGFPCPHRLHGLPAAVRSRFPCLHRLRGLPAAVPSVPPARSDADAWPRHARL